MKEMIPLQLEEFPENDHQGHAYEGNRENDTLEKRIQCQR